MSDIDPLLRLVDIERQYNIRAAYMRKLVREGKGPAQGVYQIGGRGNPLLISKAAFESWLAEQKYEHK